MNIVILSGRLSRDPEIRYTNSKKAVTTFSVAVDDGKDKDGNRKTQFVNCVAWERTAELLDQYFVKGDGITIIGKWQTRTYDKDGVKRYMTEVLVSTIEFPITHRQEEKKEQAFTDIAEDIDLPF